MRRTLTSQKNWTLFLISIYYPKECSIPGAPVSLAVKEKVTISANIGQGSEV